MLVKEVMNTDVKTIDRNATIQEAAKDMTRYGIGSLIVVKGDRVVGILTERDITRNAVVHAKDVTKTTVKEVMTKEVIMIGPETDVDDAADIMVEKDVKRLPVISGKNLVGIVTTLDLCSIGSRMIERLSSIMFVQKKRKAVAG